MRKTIINNIVNDVIINNEYEKLLLGEEPYRVISEKGMSPWGYDLIIGLEVLNQQIYDEDIPKFKKSLEKVANMYKGVIPSLITLLFIYLKRKKLELNFDFDERDVISILRKTISRHKPVLVNDKSGPGNNYENGMLGEVLRLSDNIFDISNILIVEDR